MKVYLAKLRLNHKFANVALIIILLIFSFSYLLCGYKYLHLSRFHYDEAISTYGAVRILNGEIPYRDFWTLYAPGQFYVLATIYKIFPINTAVSRLFAILILSFTSCSIYFLIDMLCAKSLAFLAFFFSLAWLKFYMVYNRPGQLAILFFIICCFPLLNFLKTKKKFYLIIVGILVAITGLFRQDFGLYFFISSFITVFLKSLFFRKERIRNLILTLKNELFLFFGITLIILPTLIYLFLHSALKEFVIDTIVFPITIYPNVRRLPFPPLTIHNLLFYIPILIFILSFIKLLFYVLKHGIADTFYLFILFLLISGLGLLNYSHVRVDVSHFIPIMIIAILLFFLLAEVFLKNFFKSKALIMSLLFLSSFILLFISLYPALIKLKFFYKHKEKFRLDINRAKGFYDDSELSQSQICAIKYIQSKTLRDEKIFVGNLRHDKIVNSDVMFYFLAGRHSATKYYELHPGLTNTQKIQTQIVGDLRKSNVRYIILWDGSENITEPNDSSKCSGIKELDNFIHNNFHKVKDFGHYKILKRSCGITRNGKTKTRQPY